MSAATSGHRTLQERADNIREYFSREGTVTRWWNPTESVLRDFFAHEAQIFDGLVGDELARRPGLRDELAVDVCTGRGRFALRLADLGLARLRGVDLSEEMLDIARAAAAARGVAVAFGRDSAESLDTLEPGAASLITLMDSFDHIPDTDAALRALYRSLAPGGALIGSIINARSAYGLMFKVYERFSGSSMIAQVFVPQAFAERLRRAGFTVERAVGFQAANFPHDRLPVLRALFTPFRALGRVEGRLFPRGFESPRAAYLGSEVIFVARRPG